MYTCDPSVQKAARQGGQEFKARNLCVVRPCCKIISDRKVNAGCYFALTDQCQAADGLHVARYLESAEKAPNVHFGVKYVNVNLLIKTF